MINRRRDIFTCIRYKSSRRFRKWVFIAHNLIWETLTLLKGAWIGFLWKHVALFNLFNLCKRSQCVFCMCVLVACPSSSEEEERCDSEPEMCETVFFFPLRLPSAHTHQTLISADISWCLLMRTFQEKITEVRLRGGTEPVCVFQITLLHCLKQSNRLDGGTLELQMWLFESRSRIKLKWLRSN